MASLERLGRTAAGKCIKQSSTLNELWCVLWACRLHTTGHPAFLCHSRAGAYSHKFEFSSYSVRGDNFEPGVSRAPGPVVVPPQCPELLFSRIIQLVVLNACSFIKGPADPALGAAPATCKRVCVQAWASHQPKVHANRQLPASGQLAAADGSSSARMGPEHNCVAGGILAAGSVSPSGCVFGARGVSAGGGVFAVRGLSARGGI